MAIRDRGSTFSSHLVTTVFAKFVLSLSAKGSNPHETEPMKRIELGHRKKWSPRTTIVFTVVDAIATGFFLGATLFQYFRGRDALSWIFPLAMAFSSGLVTLRGTLVALRNCSHFKERPQNDTTRQTAS